MDLDLTLEKLVHPMMVSKNIYISKPNKFGNAELRYNFNTCVTFHNSKS